MVRTTIFSARGKDSFTEAQQRRLAAQPVRFVAVDGVLSVEAFVLQARESDVVAVTRKAGLHIGRTVLEQLPRLKALVVFSTGVEWIDGEALAERKIELLRLEDYCSRTVAEHALGLMLALSRRIHISGLKSTGKIPKSVSLRGFELEGRTLGIIGLGTIGAKVARLAAAFGMHVLYNDSRVFTDTCARVEKAVLLQNADIVTPPLPV
jgi:phosphoglycerate dehydrogenase-like enzyme